MIVLTLVLATAAPPAPPIAEPDLVGRAVDRAVERSQKRLEDSIDVWVDHSNWANAWRVRTEHYEVRTTVSRAFGLQIAEGLETMLGHFQALLGTDYTPTEPFKIFVLPDIAAYNQFGDQFGAEHSSFLGSFYADQSPDRPVAALFDPNTTLLSMWITHSALHQFVAEAFRRQPPAWVSEGLASYFALYWDYGWGISELERIRNDSSGPGPPGGGSNIAYVPLENLLATPVQGYTDRPQSRFIELGMLFSYLLAYREDTRTEYDGEAEAAAPFAEYLRTWLRGGAVQQSPMHALLFGRTAELGEEFRSFDFGG